jgi:glycosyltransferase involved in cell wall biosynthesis
MLLSVCIITLNEEENLARTLQSVRPLVADGRGEIVIVDSGSTDRTVEIAREFNAKVFVETWKGFTAQKNSAIEKASGDWILSLDADEEVSNELVERIDKFLRAIGQHDALFTSVMGQDCAAYDQLTTDLGLRFGIEEYWGNERSPINGAELPRRNLFLNRWIKHGGFYPDPKLRLFRRGTGRFEERAVHETVKIEGIIGRLRGDLVHHAYPTLSGYIEHMNRYSSLGAEMEVAKGRRGFSFNIVLRPLATFIYNYIFRLGFLDGREGLLLHLYHSAYVSWKYAKVWELSQKQNGRP